MDTKLIKNIKNSFWNTLATPQSPNTLAVHLRGDPALSYLLAEGRAAQRVTWHALTWWLQAEH